MADVSPQRGGCRLRILLRRNRRSLLACLPFRQCGGSCPTFHFVQGGSLTPRGSVVEGSLSSSLGYAAAACSGAYAGRRWEADRLSCRLPRGGSCPIFHFVQDGTLTPSPSVRLRHTTPLESGRERRAGSGRRLFPAPHLSPLSPTVRGDRCRSGVACVSEDEVLRWTQRKPPTPKVLEAFQVAQLRWAM